jgi:hypothetical protein
MPTIEDGQFMVSIGGLEAVFNVASLATTTPSSPSLEDRRQQLFVEYERKKHALDMELKRQVDALEGDDGVHVLQ